MRDVDGVDLEAVSRFVADNRTLRHLWSEYRETLHLQTTVDPTTGVEKINAVRSTIPAEALFNTATLIEGRPFTEFFKHLPGVFTGIGIIGTFMGLIAGLRAFQISEEPSVVRESLNLLLHGVHEAFLVSAGAISLAMIVTALARRPTPARRGSLATAGQPVRGGCGGGISGASRPGRRRSRRARRGCSRMRSSGT